MINLLPDDYKKEIRAAKSNVMLFNYIIITLLATIFLAGMFATVYLQLNIIKANAESIIANKSSRDASFTTVQQQVASLKQNLDSAKVTINTSASYSNIITGIAAAMPAGVIITNLSLTPTTIGTPIVLQAYAKTTEDALKLNDSFQQSPLLSNVTIQQLSDDASNTVSGYPVSVSLNVTINKGVAQ